MSPQRIVTVPARRFTRFVQKPQVQAAFGVMLLCCCAVVIYLAKQSYDESKTRRAEQIRTQQSTREQCIRTRRLAPPLLEHFESFRGTSHALPESVLREYRLTVPKTCPK